MPLLNQLALFVSSFSPAIMPAAAPSLSQFRSLSLSRYRAFHPLLNFGVLEHTPHFTLYRSSLLGKWGLKLLSRHLENNGLPFPKTIIYLNYEGYRGRLPILGKFALEEYLLQDQYGHRFIHPFGEEGNTYLDGINPYKPQSWNHYLSPREFYLGKEAKTYFAENHLSSPREGDIANFYRILELILNPQNSPVLFHCLAGKHRTGMVALALRYLSGGEWVEGKKNLIYCKKDRAQYHLDPAQYEYFLHNQRFFRYENITFAQTFYEQDPQFSFWRTQYQNLIRG